jgi:1,4-dihydroxy-2-naphthoyl-CoA synthase
LYVRRDGWQGRVQSLKNSIHRGKGVTYKAITYGIDGRTATITLSRPERMNAISLEMPGEIAAAVDAANRDDRVHVIVLTGAGDGFCSGYDLVEFAEKTGERPGSQLGGGDGDTRPWDPMADFFGMYDFTQQFMSLWRSYKPTIARVHGPAVAGGSDIALCCDLVVMAEEAVRRPRCGSIASVPSEPSACCSPATSSTVGRRPGSGWCSRPCQGRVSTSGWQRSLHASRRCRRTSS